LRAPGLHFTPRPAENCANVVATEAPVQNCLLVGGARVAVPNELDAVPLPIPGIGDRSGEGRMRRPALQWTATIASM